MPARGYQRSHCQRGHELTEENTIQRKDRGRTCKVCARLKSQARYRGMTVGEFLLEEERRRVFDEAEAKIKDFKAAILDDPLMLEELVRDAHVLRTGGPLYKNFLAVHRNRNPLSDT